MPIITLGDNYKQALDNSCNYNCIVVVDNMSDCNTGEIGYKS
ncbi:MAG: hypothetical protein AAB703_07090 [Pseudomonadota bacterium]